MNGDSTRKHGGFTRNGDLGKNAGFELQKKPALSNHQDKTSGGCYVTILLLASQAMCIASAAGNPPVFPYGIVSIHSSKYECPLFVPFFLSSNWSERFGLHSDILRHSHIFSGEETWFRRILARQSIETWRRSLFQIRQKLPSSIVGSTLWLWHSQGHGEAIIEIDGPYRS